MLSSFADKNSKISVYGLPTLPYFEADQFF